MTIATSVKDHLNREGVPYEVITHEHTRDSNHSAQAAHIPGDQLAKCVMLEDSEGYVMAVLPATHKVDLGAVHRQLNRRLGLATDRELADLFKDCEPGAIPPLGRVYGIETIVDGSLSGSRDVYFEGGDHEALVHVTGKDFLRLMADAQLGEFSHHVGDIARVW
jgi:Ala-tRNA(Pro) deacylase